MTRLPASADSPMAQALALAQHAIALSSPNPRVGCVLTDASGTLLGQGYTQQAGGPHAEIVALRDAAARGHSVRGATAYVTLEPCAHQGRTGPCCDALIAAGIGKVVASISDPNPRVGGRGFERLKAAGIAVEVGPGAEESRELNIGFFSRMVRGTPWVRMKAAASLDGKTALNNGTSQWITGEAARADGHAWRARAGAILTGVGTVIADDPRLNLRSDTHQTGSASAPCQPPLAIVDSHLLTPPAARVFQTPGRPVWIYCAHADPARTRALEARGASVCPLPAANGQVDLAAMLRDLATREVNELHVEAGHRLNGALIRENLLDELLLYLAPRLIGEGLGITSHPHAAGPLTALTDALALRFLSVDLIGPDLRILARVAGRDSFHSQTA